MERAKESCLSGRKSRTRNAVYALRRIGGSNPSLSASLINAGKTPNEGEKPGMKRA